MVEYALSLMLRGFTKPDQPLGLCNMDEVRVKTVVLRDAGNRRAALSALLDYLGLEGFGIGSALHVHGKTLLKG